MVNYLKMKHFFILLSIALLIVSCNSTTDENYPTNLEGKKQLLKTKRASLKKIEGEISKLQSEIEELDSSIVKKVTLVTTMPVKRADYAHFIEVQGTIEADDLVAISSELGGRIVALNIREGQRVRKGQLIGKVDMEAVEKQIVELETQLDLANELYERQKRLWDQEIGSEVQLLQAENNKERLEKSLETIKVQLNKADFFAPISGVIEMVNLKQGEVAAPGAPIAMILNTQKVKIAADVPETLISAVQKGARVAATIPALGWEKEVRITELGRTIDPTNRTLKVEAEISNPNGLIKPNLLTTMKIKDLEQNDAIVLPVELIQQEVGGKDFVYVVSSSKAGKIAKKVYVETGSSYQNEIVIERGLSGNEAIIVKGSKIVSNDEAVQIQSVEG